MSSPTYSVQHIVNEISEIFFNMIIMIISNLVYIIFNSGLLLDYTSITFGLILYDF